jgi:rRNA-processing protein FCF1
VVLEGGARGGLADGTADRVTVVHAPGSGDETLIAVIDDANGQVTLVSADRALRRRAEALGAVVTNPGWLLDLLDN